MTDTDQESNSDVSQCNNEYATLSNDEMSRKIHELSCEYREVRHQVESWADEFNSLVHFINEIGINMNAAKNDIDDNKRRLTYLEAANHRGDDSREDLMREVDHIKTLINLTNQKVNLRYEVTQLDLLSFQSRADEVEASLEALTRRLNETSTVLRQFRASSPPASDFGKLNQQMRRNSLMITGNRNSFSRLATQLQGFSSEGWFNAPNGYQYFLSKSAYKTNPYMRSRRYCTNRNSDLAHIGMRDPNVFRFLWVNLIGPSRNLCVWIGLSDIAEEGTWRWMDGQEERLFWSNWAVGETRRISKREDCVMIRAGMWVKAPCTGRRRICTFLCERRILSLT